MREQRFGKLPDARYWKIRLGEECARTQRYRRPFSVLLVALADPDAPDDPALLPSEGFAALAGEALRRSIRENDVLCRLHPACFGLILAETGDSGASVVAGRLPATVRQTVGRVLPASMLPDVTVGYASAPE